MTGKSMTGKSQAEIVYDFKPYLLSLGLDHIAEDILQDAAMSMIKYPPAEHADGKTAAFLAVKWSCVKFFKTKNRLETLLSTVSRKKTREHITPERIIYLSVLLDQIAKNAIPLLQGLEREVMIETIKGQSPQEISAIYGLSAKTVRDTLCRARGRLRQWTNNGNARLDQKANKI